MLYNVAFSKVIKIVLEANVLFLFVAIFLLCLSQWISAERLFYLLGIHKFLITRSDNNKLYLLGMFYNLFIPGGIGGDAFKVYILNKTFNNWSVKKLSATMLIDRLYGVFCITALVLAGFAFIPFFQKEAYYILLLIILLLLVVISFNYFIRVAFPSFRKAKLKPIFLSFVIQLLQCGCFIMLLFSLGMTENLIPYTVVFLVSSVLSIFSFSGIGIRELIFYYASLLFSFDQTVAVTAGLLFSVITIVISLPGVVFHLNPNFSFKEAKSIVANPEV